ncbi:MAG: energy-coupling factor transporter transmembrane component T [Coriobacteriaceae bacterium]|nr:energy-coupling factor transporter transmembrane component T [Coriobacteriaceae bacterium]
MALRSSIGQYYSADSFLHRLDPRVKLVGTIAFMVSCFFVNNAPGLVLASLAIATAVASSRVPARTLLAQLKPLILFLVITSVINLFFVRTGPVAFQMGPLALHVGGIEAALLYTARFFLLLAAGSLLTLTTTPVALTDAAENLLSPLERLGVPVTQATLVLSIALRFVPTLSREAEHVIAAQTARGADLENKSAFAYARACVPLIVPLFASALRHAENLGRAMDARCYTGGERTHYHVMQFSARRDGAAVAALVLYFALLAAINLAG